MSPRGGSWDKSAFFVRGNEKRDRKDPKKQTDIDNEERGTEDESSNIYT